LERDPRAHEKVRCLRVFFVFFVWKRLKKSSSFSFFAALQLNYNAAKKKAFHVWDSHHVQHSCKPLVT
jgi:hypothetical protein